MPLHETVYSPVVNAHVDRNIVRLVDIVNLLGFRTVASCEGIAPCEDFPDGALAYVAIANDATDLMRLINQAVREIDITTECELPQMSPCATRRSPSHWEVWPASKEFGRTEQTTVIRLTGTYLQAISNHLWRVYATVPAPAAVPSFT